MFPYFNISGALIYTFWIALTLSFFIFLWNLQRLEKRFSYNFNFFSHNILWFFLSVFFFSRVFYVIARWNDMKFIKEPFQFFVMSEYNFSLFGAIFGFLLVLYILCRIEKTSINRYIDGLVLSFLFMMIVWYIWAFFGGQVYGRETMFGIEYTYTNSATPVPYQVPVFPLPIVYAIFSFLIFSGLYILSLFVHIRWYIGYLGIILFSSMILVFEFFSGKPDSLSVNTAFNFPQVFALILISWSAYQLYKVFKDAKTSTTDSHIIS